MGAVFQSRIKAGDVNTFATASTGAQAHAAGSCLIALIQWAGTTGTVSSVTNTAGDIWVQAGSDRRSVDNSSAIYYVASTAGNANDDTTAHFSAGFTYRYIVVYEFTNIPASPLDDTQFVSGTGGTNPSLNTPTLTLTAANGLVIGLAEYGVAVLTAGAGYVATPGNCTGDPNNYFLDYYHIVTASEAAQVTGTGSSGASWYNHAAMFKASGGAAPSTWGPGLSDQWCRIVQGS